jgi:hypothetical protein
MRGRNIKTRLITALFLIPSLASAQGPPAPQSSMRVDSNVVWDAPPNFREILDRKCDRLVHPAFQSCFINLMKELGASPEAVKFAMLADSSGFVRHFVHAGTVDIAYVSYPFRANENFGITLVNGHPGMIDVDDFQFVDLTPMKSDSTYLRILETFPDASVWPGDRFHLNQPEYESLNGRGQRFVVDYLIRNGCHACEDIGVARFAFDFREDGSFEGTSFLGVTSLAR